MHFYKTGEASNANIPLHFIKEHLFKIRLVDAGNEYRGFRGEYRDTAPLTIFSYFEPRLVSICQKNPKMGITGTASGKMMIKLGIWTYRAFNFNNGPASRKPDLKAAG